MGKPIIRVINLFKKYKIFHQERYLTLRDTIVRLAKSPFDMLKRGNYGASKEDFCALNDVSLDIKQGEVVGIIGRNGAGKTTLLKILSRITYPTEGEIRLCGRVGSLLEVGTGFHPELTGRENIYFNGSILGMKRREINKNFDAIVDFSGVEKFIDMPVKRYSSGMQVRLAFSVAAHLEPEILLVDEVLAVGDAQFQKKCLGKMKDVALGGRTVLFVSHNMNAVRTLCTRAIMLENGKVSLDKDTDTVVSRYLNQNLTTGISISGNQLEAKLEGVIRRDNPLIRLKEVSLLNQHGQPANIFNSDEAIRISVDYECLAIVNDLHVNVYIVDQENNPILATQNIDCPEEEGHYQRKPGLYRSVCTIQPNLFGEKRFYVSVHLLYPKVEHLVLDRVLGFDVVFLGYGTPGNLKDSFIRPRFNWDTQLIGGK
jgi:lipopolysaccharide transport system ATP-binding protein